MGRAAMRRLALSLAISTTVALVTLPVHVASAAQDEVTLKLRSQTPWVTADHPKVDLAVRATNHGADAVRNLSLSVTLLSPVRSKSAYEQSLQTDPQGSLNLLTPPPLAIHGSIPPHKGRTIAPKEIDLSFLSGSGSFVYPLRIELRSGYQILATLRTPLVFLSLPPGQHRAETPLHLSWAFILDAPVLHGPGGTFDGSAVADLLDRDGALRGEIDGLLELVKAKHPVPVDVVVSPLLLRQLDRMSHGFAVRRGGTVGQIKAGQGMAAVAAAVLEHLRSILHAPSVEVSAIPFASPDVPALLDAGLEKDVAAQVALGRDEVHRIAGVEPATDLMRPSGSFLDQASLVELQDQGFDRFLLDSRMVERPPQAKEFTQPATAGLEVGPGAGDTATAVIPDQGSEDLLSSDLAASDPRLAAHAVLGELAQIWLEQPGVKRPLAIAITQKMHLAPSLFRPLVKGISSAPWITVQSVTDMAAQFRPSDPPASLVPRIGPSFPSWFVTLLDEARHELGTYRSMLVGSSPLPHELETSLLVSESSAFPSGSESGAGFVTGVRERLQQEFRKVGLETAPLFTLPSRGGNIPVGVTSTTGYPIRVQVRLISNHLDISREVQRVEVSHRTVLPFRVHAKTTGRFPVQIRILTPSGFTLDTRQIVVRSTAYNLVALLITIGAGAFLLLWWARRFLPRKTA
jgi:hypothetical protein